MAEDAVPPSITLPGHVSKKVTYWCFGGFAVFAVCLLLGSAWSFPLVRSLTLLSFLFVLVGVLGNGAAATLVAGLIYEIAHPDPDRPSRWRRLVLFTTFVVAGAAGFDVLVVKASTLRWLFLIVSIATAVAFYLVRTAALNGESWVNGGLETAIVGVGAGVGGFVTGSFLLVGVIVISSAVRVSELGGPGIDPRTPRAAIHLQGGYVALGDSYSAGEGQSPYDERTRLTGCHRSAGSAYPVLLAASDWSMQPFSFRACSGAVVSDIYALRNSQLPVAPQVQTGVTDSSIKLVTITIGGNDLGFATILERCLLEKNCLVHQSNWPKSGGSRTTLAAWAPTREVSINSGVTTLLGKLKVSFPQARVIVIGYPHLFPPGSVKGGHLPDDCSIFLRRYIAPERDWVNQQIDLVDAMYAKDVVAGGFEFVSPVAAWVNHEPCGKKGQYTSAEKINLTAPLDAFDVEGAFHPNSAGQAAIAGLVSCYLDKNPSRPAAGTPGKQGSC